MHTAKNNSVARKSPLFLHLTIVGVHFRCMVAYLRRNKMEKHVENFDEIHKLNGRKKKRENLDLIYYLNRNRDQKRINLNVRKNDGTTAEQMKTERKEEANGRHILSFFIFQN